MYCPEENVSDQLIVLERFLKDHVTLKKGVMMLYQYTF